MVWYKQMHLLNLIYISGSPGQFIKEIFIYKTFSWSHNWFKYKLQVAQNSAVQLIEKLKKYDHVSSSRQQLHWLPIQARIHFKLLMTTWKAIKKQAPQYIQQLIKVRQQQNHNLRSNNKVMLESPSPLNKNKHEERAFSFAAPILWNPLPEYVKNAATLFSFKKNLKTHLFQKFYKNWSYHTSANEQFIVIGAI